MLQPEDIRQLFYRKYIDNEVEENGTLEIRGVTFKYDVPDGSEGWRVSASNSYGAFSINLISKPITQEYGRDFHIVGGWNESIHWKFSSV